jgi:hypothetical protein
VVQYNMAIFFFLFYFEQKAGPTEGRRRREDTCVMSNVDYVCMDVGGWLHKMLFVFFGAFSRG